MSRVAIHPVRCLKDNYAYLIVDEASGEAAVVDASEAAPVEAALDEAGARLVAIWNTHPHHDHVGGNEDLVERRDVRDVVASRHDGELGRVPAQTHLIGPDEEFVFAGHRVRTLAIPAHTLGHLAYQIGDDVFPGDTLFGGGCGRLFEGTPALMVAALGRLRALPDQTRIWCGHEYTLHNLKFAIGIEPDNAALAARLARVRALPPASRTVPLSLVEERATNPMLRWDSASIQRFAGTADPVAAFAAVRSAKDVWRET